MLSAIYNSAKFIIGVFSLASFTALLICKYNDIPFSNPKHNRYQLVEQCKKIASSSGTVLGQSIIVHALFKNMLMDTVWHSFSQTAINLCMYSVIVELTYYIYHRVIHTKEYYKTIHAVHHENIEVYPLDAFYIDKMDTVFLVGSLTSPMLFLRFNYFELFLMLWIYGTSAYMAHSTLFFSHHAVHHKLMFWNYCILNPMFDILCRTYRP
jgi:sterol desaturase/sphingolipid hydroxylase (fatty acid hydroxylase superfamily)